MGRSESTGARLGRAAAMLVRQRQRLRQARLEQAGAQAGRAAGAFVGNKIHAHAQTPGVLKQALARSRRHFWARAGSALSCLGLQVTGVLFLFFALGFGIAGVQSWMADRTHAAVSLTTSLTQASSTTQLELALALIFAYFGISGLFRAAARRS
ncbi:MAG: hypothetical protein ACRD04_03360 [Terriglobales bacterium]